MTGAAQGHPFGAPQPGSLVARLDLEIWPDPARTVLRPFELATDGDRDGSGGGRLNRPLAQVRDMAPDQLAGALAYVDARLAGRHRDADAVLRRNGGAASALVPDVSRLDPARRRLPGGYLTEEYRFEAAALFNPSVMLHPWPDDATPAMSGSCWRCAGSAKAMSRPCASARCCGTAAGT